MIAPNKSLNFWGTLVPGFSCFTTDASLVEALRPPQSHLEL